MKLLEYEFTDQKVIKKFKKTEYGKKCNKYLHVSASMFAIVAVVMTTGLFALRYYCEEQVFQSFIDDYGILYIEIITVLAIAMCYFSGKRDGAIKQFELKGDF